MRLNRYLITESVLKQHIKAFKKLLSMQENPNPKQLEYWDWQDKEGKVIKCKSYKSDPKLEEIIERDLIFTAPVIKECYRNAWMVAAKNSREIDVVVGYSAALGAIPIEHAWNYYKPKKIYFDLTFELCLKKDPTKETYLQLIKTNAGKATKIMTSTKFTVMGFIAAWFNKHH